MTATRRVIKIENGTLGVVVAVALTHRVERVAFHLDRTTVECRGQQWDGATTTRLGRGEGHGFPGNHPLGGLGKGNQMGLRTSATAQAQSSQSQRGAHEAEKVSAGQRVLLPFGGAGREFAVQPLFEVCGLAVLAKAAPVGATIGGGRGMLENSFHRWHPLQLTGGLTFQSRTNFSPSSRWVVPAGGSQSIFVTWSSGRRWFSGAR